jgi:hypothetical protein
MRLKLYAAILFIIGLLASFYLPGILLKVATRVYSGSASPYNLDWSGTSLLVERLKRDGYRVVIVNETSQLMGALRNGGLLLLIAPDNLNIGRDEAEAIAGLVNNGTLSLAVFDENTTSNIILSYFGLMVDGRALLDPSLPDTPQYPRVLLVDREGRSHMARLNWASIVRDTSTYNYGCRGERVFALGKGLVDLNNNGKPDEATVYGMGEYYPVGVLCSSPGGSGILVYADSFPMLNIALEQNYTLSKYLIDYVEWLSNMSSRRIVIPQFTYKSKIVEFKLPFHVSILMLIASSLMHTLDKMFDSFILSNIVLKTLSTLFVILGLALIYKAMFKTAGYSDYEPKPRDEILFFSEVPVTKSMMSGKIEKGREAEIIVKYWRILNMAYSKVTGFSLESVVGDIHKLETLASTLRTNPRDLHRKVNYMYKIYLKASGARRLPIIIRWRKTASKYIIETDYLLRRIGYTVYGKERLKHVLYLVKK